MNLRFLLILFLIAFHLSGVTQFALINSTTGSARALENEYSEEELILQNGELVYILMIDAGTVIVDYDLGGEVLHSAAFSETDILDLTLLYRVPKLQESPDSVVFGDGHFAMTMTRDLFVAKDHQLSWSQPDSASDYKYLSQIDQHQVFGTDGNLPVYEMNAAHFATDQFSGILATEILYEPNFLFTEVYLDKTRNRYIVSTLGSDGAGSYAAYWIIDRNGKIEPVVTIPF